MRSGCRHQLGSLIKSVEYALLHHIGRKKVRRLVRGHAVPVQPQQRRIIRQAQPHSVGSRALEAGRIQDHAPHGCFMRHLVALSDDRQDFGLYQEIQAALIPDFIQKRLHAGR